MKLLSTLFVFLLLLAPLKFSELTAAPSSDDPLALPAEKHLRNMRQLTFGGENAEAYFSADGRELIFQSKRDGRE
ncbi:MAG: hypothetical protein QOJ02_1610, partial [Acidobacteriota bacterium]|nr:hypothetical protein [Acidobacteriota bacterium]